MNIQTQHYHTKLKLISDTFLLVVRDQISNLKISTIYTKLNKNRTCFYFYFDTHKDFIYELVYFVLNLYKIDFSLTIDKIKENFRKVILINEVAINLTKFVKLIEKDLLITILLEIYFLNKEVNLIENMRVKLKFSNAIDTLLFLSSMNFNYNKDHVNYLL